MKMMNSEQFKTRLLALKAETLAMLDKSEESSKPVALDQTLQGRLSRMDALQQQEMALATKRRRKTYLMQIDQALLRLENEEYGYCSNCDEEIGRRRLELNPVVLTCIQCAEKRL